LDAHYLVEKTVITKNTYDTFAHLSDDEKDLLLSPEAAKLAQTIQSVLPDDGKRKKIYFKSDFTYNVSLYKEKEYFVGKLYYYLYPNFAYALTSKMPLNIWKKGGFYFVDIRIQTPRWEYNFEKKELSIDAGEKVSAMRLLNNDGIEIYYIPKKDNKKH
ncbi:MAG: hypothetical protein CSA42_01545, partial [Gammaproteobacteria bacterium]